MSNKNAIATLSNSVTKVEVVRVFATEYSKPSVSISEYSGCWMFLTALVQSFRHFTDSNRWMFCIYVTKQHEGNWCSREEITSTEFIKCVVWEFFTQVIPDFCKVLHRHDEGIEHYRKDWEGNLKEVLPLEEQERAIRQAVENAISTYHEQQWLNEMKEAEQSSTVADAFDPIKPEDTTK